MVVILNVGDFFVCLCIKDFAEGFNLLLTIHYCEDGVAFIHYCLNLPQTVRA